MLGSKGGARLETGTRDISKEKSIAHSFRADQLTVRYIFLKFATTI